MDLNRLRALVAAPIACLFLMLMLYVFGLRQPHRSMGLRIPMIRVPDHSDRVCSDPNRIIVLRPASDDKYWINSTEIKPGQLQAILTLITENRSDHIVYMQVDGRIPYEKFASVLEIVSDVRPKLHIALLTDRLLKRLLARCCGWVMWTRMAKE